MRDTAGAPQPPTIQQRGHQMSQQGLCVQESTFWGKNGRFQFKHPNYFVREQNFCYKHIRKLLRHLVRIVLLVKHGTKWIREANIWPKMTKNAYFGPNLAVFGPEILIYRE